MSDLVVRAIRFEQNGRVFYTAAMNVADLIDVSAVDEWKFDEEEDARGYQRSLQMPRVRRVAQYVTREDAVMPVGGLVNARSANGGEWGDCLPFAPDTDATSPIQSGTLTIPDSARPLWIVDMQHRLAGFEHAILEMDRADLREYPVAVTIADGLSKMEEIEQFELINTTQKKVATDLARQLLARQYKIGGLAGITDPTKVWEARGAIVANWLDEQGGVFQGRIIPPNKTARQIPRGVTKQTTFVSSLKPVLTAPYIQRKSSEEEIAQYVDQYWQAVASIWPQAIEFPKDSVILKGPGVYPLHMMMPEVMEVVRDKNQPFSREAFAAAIADWRDLGEDYWDKDNTESGATRFGSSGQGHLRIANELRLLLPS
jgi:DGQHR domain-containing protein